MTTTKVVKGTRAATSSATSSSRAEEGLARPRLRRPALTGHRCLVLVVALALLVPTFASASDVSLKTTLAGWSHRISADARGVGLSARNRHPGRMTTRARHFRLDALRARRALAAQRPSSAPGRRAKTLALDAFRAYAFVGREWVLSGRARVHRNTSGAVRHARLARRSALKANRLLVAAGKLLR